jgi:hypothetical protein
MKMKMYATANTESSDETEHYWELYDSLPDAVQFDGLEVFSVSFKRIGKFKRKVQMVKIKQRKRKTK